MIWVFRDILVCCMQVYMLYDMGKNFFEYRQTSIHRCLLISIFIIIAIRIINSLDSTVANMIGVPLCYIIATILAFKGNIWNKAILACCFYILAILPEFIFAAATNAYGVLGSSKSFQNEFVKTVAIALMKLVTFLLIKCIGHIRRKRNCLEMENKMFMALLLLPAATIIMLGFIYYSGILNFAGAARIVLPVGAALLLVTNIFIFSIFDRLLENEEKVKKMERLYQKSRAENNNLKYVAKINEEHKVFLHDINRFIRTAGELLLKDERKSVEVILEQLGTRIGDLREYQYSTDLILNSILSERKFLADNKCVQYDIFVEKGLSIDFIEELDLISIVGNLLDNALEAAEKVGEEGFVKGKIYTANNNNFLAIEIENNFMFSPKKGPSGYVTRKRNVWNHGVGIHTVERLVKYYNGIMNVKSNENSFRVSIIIPIKR